MDGWMDGWMDGEVLIRYLDKWMTCRSCFGLGLRGGVRWGERWVPWGVAAFAADRGVDSYFLFKECFLKFF
jgi:hypothetical protein